MANDRYEGDGSEGKRFGSGFEEWKRRQAAKAAADPSLDAAYAQYKDAALGLTAQERAGVVSDGQPGAPAAVDFSEGEGLSDDQAYTEYTEELNGTSARRRAVEAEQRHQRDRENEALRNARLHGYPLPSDLEHLRPKLRDHGY